MTRFLFCFMMFITNEQGELENVKGRVFIPMRYADELQAARLCGIVYEGLRKPQTGGDNHDISIIPVPKCAT